MSDSPARSGRFAEAADALLHRLNRSVAVDQRLWREDLDGSLAHARMLASVALLTAHDLAELERGLAAVRAELERDAFVFQPEDEDVHMAVERRLGELVGEPARRLHTGRSRNDQVATDTLLWLRRYLLELRADIVIFATTLLERAAEGTETPMPSFTHAQPAQVSSVAEWLLAHAAAAERTLRRLDALHARLDECPLGSGASAGSYLPLDRAHTARALGFARPAVNAIQATGSRADLLDAAGLLAVLGVDLSRLGEELVYLSSPQYAWIALPDRLTTGSSLLPHKRNPDGAELLRAGGKLAASDFAALAAVTSALFSGYSKDLQHDKEVLFRAADRSRDLVQLATAHVAALAWDASRLRAACTEPLAALYLADRLVLAGVPFREAHHLVGRAARIADEAKLGLGDALRRAHAEARASWALPDFGSLAPEHLLAALKTAGSASPQSTREQIAALRARL